VKEGRIFEEALVLKGMQNRGKEEAT